MGRPGHGAVRALNAKTGEKVWDLELVAKPMNGVMSTASKLVFTGSASGHFYALDAETGEELWRVNLGGQGLAGIGDAAAIYTAPITYMSQGRQMVSVSAGHALFTFALGGR